MGVEQSEEEFQEEVNRFLEINPLLSIEG